MWKGETRKRKNSENDNYHVGFTKSQSVSLSSAKRQLLRWLYLHNQKAAQNSQKDCHSFYSYLACIMYHVLSWTLGDIAAFPQKWTVRPSPWAFGIDREGEL